MSWNGNVAETIKMVLVVSSRKKNGKTHICNYVLASVLIKMSEIFEGILYLTGYLNKHNSLYEFKFDFILSHSPNTSLNNIFLDYIKLKEVSDLLSGCSVII